jgi:hypothetical protein
VVSMIGLNPADLDQFRKSMKPLDATDESMYVWTARVVEAQWVQPGELTVETFINNKEMQ